MKRFFCISLVFLLLMSTLTGCGGGRQFTKEGLTITLPASFTDETGSSAAEDATFFYTSRSCVILGTKEDRATLEDLVGPLTLEAYGALIIQLNGTGEALSEKDGLYTFQYEASVENVSYTYLAAVYEAADAFWLVQTFCTTDNYPRLSETMFGYLKTVTIA